MQAKQFYSSTNEHAIPLILLTIEEKEHTEKLKPYEHNCLNSQGFKGRLGDVGIVCDNDGKTTHVYVGAGERGDKQALAYAATRVPAGHYALAHHASNFALLVWSLAQYRFDKYKPTSNPIRTLAVDKTVLPALLNEADAVFLVRDLINLPTNDLGPTELADAMATLAKKHGADFNQWVGDELLQDNFPAIHAVGRAAADAPRLLHLSWGNPKHPKITLIGKGVCFDSGGLDIKPASAMRLMKKDMGGAAQVIGLAQWIMSCALPIHLQVYVPAVENAISSNSFRPGDVLTMRNGLKVEIDNTDAEGRLLLADALSKACEDSPELIIDFSTLTGAARVAVGTEISAIFSNNDDIAQTLGDVGSEVGDFIWRLPLHAEYRSLLESGVADLANASTSPYAGAITAALFLQYFIEGPINWVHFDIMAWNVGSKPGKPDGGEAMGMQAVAHYLIGKYGQ